MLGGGRGDANKRSAHGGTWVFIYEGRFFTCLFFLIVKVELISFHNGLGSAFASLFFSQNSISYFIY
jgi:hypothetical protein